jgi:hypothetical protein
LEHENIQGVKRIFDIYKIKLNNALHMCKICKTYKVIKIPFAEQTTNKQTTKEKKKKTEKNENGTSVCVIVV